MSRSRISRISMASIGAVTNKSRFQMMSNDKDMSFLKPRKSKDMLLSLKRRFRKTGMLEMVNQ